MSYYMGDPSFLGALWGGVKGFVTGGWGGAITGAIAGSHGPSYGAPAAAGAAPHGGVGPTPLANISHAVGYGAGTAVRAIGQHPYLSAAGAAAGGGGLIAAHYIRGGHPAAAGGVGVGARGYHVSKRTGALVRNRRMNVCNPRALRRAIRRARGFEKLALKSIRLVSPHRLKRRHFGGFKTRRRK